MCAMRQIPGFSASSQVFMYVGSYKAFYIIFSLILLTSCFDRPGQQAQALKPYTQAMLIPGVGLADLRLGESTLAWMLESFGTGLWSILYADDTTTMEFSFQRGELKLSFLITGQCQVDTGTPYELLQLKRGINVFLQRYPSCNELTLTQLQILARSSNPRESFFKGMTSQGISLWTSLAEIDLPLHEGIEVGLMLASETATMLDMLDYVSLAPGLNLYLGPKAQKLLSDPQGAYLETPQKPEELSATHSYDLVVRRLSIFQPYK